MFYVARVESMTPDLVIVRRGVGSLTGTAEVHVLSGATPYRNGNLLQIEGRYQAFVTHERLASAASAATLFAFGPSKSGPSVYSLSEETSRTC
jgi:hypothetical protein